MLLTITYTGENATDIGFLLHKNPQRPQVFDIGYGTAYVFYPKVEQEECTAALLLDIDPLDLARGKVGSREGGLFDYVNDRPYVCSSFMSTAISRVFGTALAGRCEKKPELLEAKLNLTAVLTMLPCRADTELLQRIFQPLGYSVLYDSSVLDEKYPQWGNSRYVNLTLQGHVRLQDLLRHLYVLIPVFDYQKHYWVGKEEIDKLLKHGEGWLEEHPEKETIIRRYMGRRYSLARRALELLDDGEAIASEDDIAQAEEISVKPLSLNTRRLDKVLEALSKSGAKTVIDMGCGEGNLLQLLKKDKSFTRIAGMDVSFVALERAAQRLKLERLPDAQKERIQLFQSSLTYKDDRFAQYDAACVIEVIEHLDSNRLSAFERILFGEAIPKTVILTTPNVEYNANYANLAEETLRHGDHRFEWTRDEFTEWGNRVAEKYGYTVVYSEIGDQDEEYGTPTQMGVFTRCE